MKLILVGIGSFGSGWYRELKEGYPNLQVAVVDTDPAVRARIHPADRFYTSLVKAIEKNARISS